MGGQEPGRISVPAIPRGGVVGRTAESAAIRRALDRARLVSVTGLPGVGKTAVSLAAAAAVRTSFADGAWLAPLDSVADGDGLAGAIAAALGEPLRPGRDPVRALVGRLRDRRLLLVLDTCEHLTGACSELVTRLLLMPGRDIRILATGREALMAPGGLTVTVRPLPLRFAVTLFGRRAAEVLPDFRITQENRAVVQEICLRLDRLPLAIELAARQVANGSLEQLEGRLKADYWFLRNPAGDGPARHESLRAAIGWSYRQCTPAERALWARLSVFAGSFRLRDAQDVCAGECLHEQAIGTAVTMLVTRSVLLTEVQTGREIQFRLPATLRAYGAAVLAEEGDGQWERRYRAWQADRGSRHWYPGEGR
jgi:predicted ATPase